MDPSGESYSKAREVVLRFGWNSTCYQILNPGITHWFSRRCEGIVGYVKFAGFRVVAGAPVSSEAELTGIVKEFESVAASDGCKVCYFAAEQRFEQYAQPQPEYSFLLLGAQPVWRPEELLQNIESKASLRMQVRRSANKGVVVEEWDPLRATNDPRLRDLLREWLSSQGLPSLHFLVEPQTLSQLEDRRIFVATLKGDIVGFLNASPIPLRNGWLVEQFVRANDAPNGTIELLLFEMARTFTSEKSQYLTLGLSPLSKHAGERAPETSRLIRALLYWAKAHGKRFYNFEGLEFFKNKFEPTHWVPIYAVTTERRFSIRGLYAIAAAFTNGHPILAVLGGVIRAVRQEIRWLRQKRLRARS